MNANSDSPTAGPVFPGRLSNPDNTMNTDPRADPRLVKALAEFGFDGPPEPSPVNADSPLQEQYAFLDETELGYEEMFTELTGKLTEVPGIDRRVETIQGVDGNDISLFIHRPADASGELPCVYHIHGGGMVLLAAANPLYSRWRDELARLGMVVVGVEFRNGAGKLGRHPFPAGLNDCMSGLEWTFHNKQQLGISNIVVSGESGGGNLTLALTLKASQDGKLELIDGVYAMCPYISAAYAHKLPELVSLYENDGLFLDCEVMGALAVLYDPGQDNRHNPLCWPYYASKEDLAGLPPHVISVNELDPLRDEGLAYYRKLVAAGVNTCCRTVNGTCHAADMIFMEAIPDVCAATLQDIRSFAGRL